MIQSKLLLLGEHIVIRGAAALVLPFPNFYGNWDYNIDSHKFINSKKNLYDFLNYIKILENENQLLCKIDIENFENALNKGLYFDSNIPQGYGLGSSGAVVAAVYDSFGLEKMTELPQLKKAFAQLENNFHGASSGIDPLACYVGKPILMRTNNDIVIAPIENKKIEKYVYLINTNIKRKAEKYIYWFQQQLDNQSFIENCDNILVRHTNDAIRHFIANDIEKLFFAIANISLFQYNFCKPMIPKSFHTLWQMGLDSDDFRLKICGAGGGGFILAFAKKEIEWAKIIDVKQHEIIPLSSPAQTHPKERI